MTKSVRGMFAWAALLTFVGVAGASTSSEPGDPALSLDDVHAASFEAGKKKCTCANGCKMQKWMKKSMTAAVSSGDGAKLAKALDHVAAKAPKGYKGWSKMAKDGADKARSGDIKGAKVSCKACHDKFQKRYVESSARCDGW